jgi:hypothetical protein
MIRTKTYTGIDVYHDKKTKETVTNTIPQIISHKLFEEANERRQATLVRKGQMNKTTKFYLFRDFLFCSCGRPLSGRIKHEGKEQLYYCPLPERRFNSSSNNIEECTMKRSLAIPATDEEVWQVVLNTLGDSIRIRTQFENKNIFGQGLKAKDLKKHINMLKSNLVLFEAERAKVEAALIKIEKENALGHYSNETVYKGLKTELNKLLTDIIIKMESTRAELGHLNDKGAWLEWLDELASLVTGANNFTPTKKRKFLNHVLKRIDVGYDEAAKLHRLNIKFRLPLLSDLDGIIKHNPSKTNNTLRTVKYFRSLGTPVNTGGPDFSRTLYSTVVNYSSSDGILDGQIYKNNRFYITLNVVYCSATLWHPPYSEYQQFLFDTISKMHADGNSYIKIAQWMNEQGHLTPRGSVFKANHAWSIHMKKTKSINRFARTYVPEITSIGVDII